MCFITVKYGENEELLINPNCRQLAFMGYLREKCQYNENAFIDLLDEQGKLAMVHDVDLQKNVRENFEDRLVYIPVMLEKEPGETGNIYKTVKPLLEDWEKKFPQLEKKIKILTGEIKRKKSPGKEGRRSLERKLSIKNDVGGRSTSVVGKASSLASPQISGRVSAASKTSATGKKSTLGNKADGGKRKGKKK